MPLPSRRRRHRSLAGGILLVGAAALLRWAGELTGPGPSAFDRATLAAIRGAGPPLLRHTAIGVTMLGSGIALTLAVLAAAAVLLARRRPLDAAALAATCWSGGRVVAIVKDLVGRPRPDVADRLVTVTSASFPSAHAANSAIVGLTLTALALQGRNPRRAGMALAVPLVAAIGASRVYLGVHWPTDVLAGWTFGACWALGWWWLTAPLRPA